eukprot:8907-Heterococcus_DN1.PRE.4
MNPASARQPDRERFFGAMALHRLLTGACIAVLLQQGLNEATLSITLRSHHLTEHDSSRGHFRCSYSIDMCALLVVMTAQLNTGIATQIEHIGAVCTLSTEIHTAQERSSTAISTAATHYLLAAAVLIILRNAADTSITRINST